MLRRRGCVLIQLLSSASASATSPLHPLISAAALPPGFAAAEDYLTQPQALARGCILYPPRRLLSSISPSTGFCVEDYLVSTCGLTRPQALKASPKLSHLRSPANPDAVLAFLAGLGLSTAAVASAVAKDPLLLCARVDRTLAPVVDGLTGLGFSHSEIARLLSHARDKFRCRSIVPKLQYYLHLFGSSEKLLRAINFNTTLLSYHRKVQLNVAFLRECGLADCHIARLPGMVTSDLERVRAVVALAEGLGVPRGSRMFRHTVDAVAFLDEKKIAAKVDHLKKTLRWSDAEVSIALPKAPLLLRMSSESLQRTSEFLISHVGLEPAYIAHRPALLNYSLERRLRPRYYVVKFLKENGLLKRDPSHFTVFKETDKFFLDKFICPHKEVAPFLAEDYAAACRGEVPARFRFT